MNHVLTLWAPYIANCCLFISYILDTIFPLSLLSLGGMLFDLVIHMVGCKSVIY